LREALAVARAIRYGSHRAEALAGLVPRLAELGYPEEALAAARPIEDEHWRTKALSELAAHLVALPPAFLYPLWCNTLPILAARRRKDVLSDLPAVAPVIQALGGLEAIAETLRAIQDVGRWWP
jgi:hypothetical protein